MPLVAPPGLAVRWARPGEADRVYPLVAALAGGEGATAPHPVAFTGVFERSFDGGATYRFVVAERSRAVVGAMTLHARTSTWAARPVVEVQDVFVVPDARRRGVARALLAFAERHARSAGAARIELQVLRSNEAAKKLYAELGYRGTEYELWRRPVSLEDDAVLDDLFRR
ncbi:MAG TPA: GNAT family N-acetyltransferase [Candidatus Thermoplasmatota archaeon]|nr:GNAT family N-acetyltransferase [Candidatus Thermoplasmatota archaeon]